ncbi:MAG: SRPBCC family protein, partial [Pyrinomonadaceae bacterium]
MGDYEIYFHPTGEKGQRGAEGTKILAIQPLRMLSFSWNNPRNFPEVRWQYTSVVVRLEKVSDETTRVSLFHTGWGDGKGWDEAFKFFDSGWQDQVLPYLKHSLEVGPVNWKNPPKLSQAA